MSSVAGHYASLLAKHYTWMFGIAFEEKVAEQKALLEKILADSPGYPASLGALDLGSGPGFQSIALAELGFSPVIAVDTSAELLSELKAHTGSRAIETRQTDLTSPDTYAAGAPCAIAVCMGDTLTHLPSRPDVEAFFSAVFNHLASGGIFAITYRDLTPELAGLDRFIPVRSDEDKIMTCFLEYESEATVLVNDLIHIRNEQTWTLNKSSYRKLRLSQQWVEEALKQAGFTLQSAGSAGRLTLLVVRK
jgi:SAM-dependent methyltransferase